MSADQSTVKLSQVPKKVPSVNDLSDFRFGWNARDRIFYGLADNGNDSREVVPIGGAVQGTPTAYGGFKGTCDLHTDPGVPEADEWWSATEVGVYANFGDVEVTTMDEVFNYIRWSQATETWSIETVAINMAMVQIPKVVDGVWDLNVSKNLEIEVKPYPFRKIADPGYPYFYAGAEANPAYHNRLNLDGDLYLSKLFAWGINMPSGTPLKWLTLDANKNIAFSDAPAGGVTPTDNILFWDAASSAYKPYTSKKISDPGYPYFMLTGSSSYSNVLRLDGTLYLTSLVAYGGIQSMGTNVSGAINGNVISSVYSGSAIGTLQQFTTYLLLKSKDWASGYRPIVFGNYDGNKVTIDVTQDLVDINMTKVRFNKGTASRYLYVDANKEVGYTEMPAVEVRVFNTENLATSRYIILEPSAKYAYAIVSLYCMTQNSTTIVHVEKNSTVYGDIAFETGTDVEILGGYASLPASLAVNDILKLYLPGGEGRCTFRLILKRTTI